MGNGISYEDYLDKYGELTYSNVGVSMLPLLRQGKDLFIVKKKEKKRCKKGDVVLYRRPPDKYVLHRIIRVRENDYVILGDNCINKEYGIKDSSIIGVMTGFVRNGKQHTVKELSYHLYSYYILHTIPVRIFCKKVMWKIKRVLKRIIHNNG